jgi:acylphosphatase
VERAKTHLFIKGRVQGVFYRSFTRDLANSFDLKGWVRNLRDGSVEVVFEGEKEKIDMAVKKCFIGPPGSKVTDIEIKWDTFTGDQEGFSIRY